MIFYRQTESEFNVSFARKKLPSSQTNSRSYKGTDYNFYDFFPKEWLEARLYTAVSICKVKFESILDNSYFNFSNPESYGLMTCVLGDIQMTVFYGSINYQLLHDEDIALADRDSGRVSLNINNAADNGYYLMFTHKLSELGENDYSDYDISYIPAIAIAEYGLYSIEKVLFSKVFELSWHEVSKSYANTLTISLYRTNLIPYINKDSMWSFGNTYHTLKKIEDSSDFKKAAKIKLSLNWFTLSIEGSNVNKLISMWIAIESLVLDGVTDLKPLRIALSNAYGIPIDKVENKFYVGRIFRLRSNVVHKGQNSNIPNTLIEYLSCLYKDLLNYSLDIPCKHFSDSYIDNNPVFATYIRGNIA